MNLHPSSIYTIRFSDCDPFGHLNNARYFDYFLNAREDHLKDEYKLDLAEFYSKGVSWVVGGHEISYMKPASYNERVMIRSSVLKATNDSLFVEMAMTDEAGTGLKSLLWTRFIHVNTRTAKKENHSESFMEWVRSVEIQETEIFTGGFQKRLKELMENAR